MCNKQDLAASPPPPGVITHPPVAVNLTPATAIPSIMPTPSITSPSSVVVSPPTIATAPPQPDVPMLPGGWPPLSTTYPPELVYLINLDYLFINQEIEWLEVLIDWESKNRYAVTDIRGETIFYVAEESGFCWRLCLGRARPCKFSIYDKNQREVLRMIRPFRFESCCCPCYLPVLEVYSGNTLLGSVTREWSLWRPIFYVRDASGLPVLMIKGPIIRFCVNVTFKIKSMDGKHRVGVIRKQWSGFAREFFTVADKFGINFPQDLDVKIKAVLMGACILIDLLYFENKDSQTVRIDNV